ncbi:MAG: DedA family protein [Ignavibacteriales bacterium]|nr:DedA family protein [Ignavibacteriales bacterium]
MEDFLQNLSELNPLWVYLTVAGIAYIENILPPFPSDVVLVACGALIGIGRIDFVATVLIATAGSTLGFMSMYKIGDWVGDRIIETGKIKFIPVESVRKVEEWFRRYGYAVIVVNRFLAGTRAVVSFFAGLSELSLWKTTVLSFVSALVWNTILLFAGKTLGSNWSAILFYLETYSKSVTAIVILALLILVGRYFYRRQNLKTGK